MPEFSAISLEAVPESRAGFLGRLSIEKKLPLIMGTVLLLVIVTVSAAAYAAMRRAAFAVAAERLVAVTTQFAQLFEQSTKQLRAQVIGTASKPAVVGYARTRSPGTRAAAIEALHYTGPQPESFVANELRNSDGTLLATSAPPASLPTEWTAEAAVAARTPDSAAISEYRVLKDTIVYFVATPVPGVSDVSLVTWRRIAGSSRSRDQINKLIGSEASLFLGNANGTVWTNLEKIVPAPPVKANAGSPVQMYERGPDTRRYLAASALIPGTPWMLVIDFATKPILAQVDAFMQRIVLIAIIALALGLFAAWFTSHRITTTLGTLTRSADAIAAGDYSQRVTIRREDELGRLARAFNTMVGEVNKAHGTLRESAVDLERRVSQRTHELAVANRELEAFAYSVSHDLRTPLRALDGFSMALLDDYGDKLDDQAKDYLGRIRGGSQRMGDLIDALLSLSRVSRDELHVQHVDLSALARDINEQLRSAHPNRRVAVTIAPDMRAVGDPALLRNLLDNLFSNAWKYSSRAQQPRIDFSAVVDPEHGLVYVVRDNGAGFDMSHAGKLFGAFQRLHTQKDFEGTGVGLATAQRIIHRHGGDIWAESSPNQGATFYFTLPERDDPA